MVATVLWLGGSSVCFAQTVGPPYIGPITASAIVTPGTSGQVPPGGRNYLDIGDMYNNSTNDLAIRFDPGLSEIGNEIILGGTDRYLTDFSFEYWGLSSDPSRFAGTVQARVVFYQNNGPLFNGYATPGTCFYDSGWFSVPAPTPRSTFVFSAAHGDFYSVPLLLPESGFIWTVQFQGMGLGDSVGVDVYGPPTVGGNSGDFWQRIGTSWFLMNNFLVPPYADFAADLIAEPPATVTRIIGVSGNLAFGNVPTGTTAEQTMTIANSGNATLTVSGITYPAGFSGAWSGTIAAGGSQNVTVTFAPTAATSYGGTVTVNSDATSGTSTINASGTGTTLNAEPPKVTCSVTTSTMWPPQHDLINVGLAASAVDNYDGTLPSSSIIVKVFSNEADLAPASGNFSPDAKNIGLGTLRLRLERSDNGHGRVYLIVVSATDSSGLTGFACTTVTVPLLKNAPSIGSVAAQAAAAQAYAASHNGAPPPGYFVIGNGPIVGLKQ